MSPAEIAEVVRLRLAAELVDDRAAVERRATAIATMLSSTEDARLEHLRTLALAFEVDRWYTGVEAILERALRTIDGDVPSGAGWHQELLRAASVAIDDGRPAILGRELSIELREVLRFRHFTRHAYDVEPDPARVRAHADRIVRLGPTLSTALDTFDAWLHRR